MDWRLDLRENIFINSSYFGKLSIIYIILTLINIFCHLSYAAPTVRPDTVSAVNVNSHLTVESKNLLTIENSTSSGSALNNSQKLNKAKFRQMSRMAFKSLVSSNYEDDQLQTPEFRNLPKEEKRRLRKERKESRRRNHQKNRNRQKVKLQAVNGSVGSDTGHLSKVPNKRQAFVIATNDSIKKGICRTMPMKQRVHMDGCLSKVVMNKYCYGQCNSFFIPKLSSTRLRSAFESCSVCQPREYTPVFVTLQCPSRTPSMVRKKIITIKECACMPIGAMN